MNLNPVKLFLSPRSVVKTAFEKPSIPVSFLLVLLPAILFFVFNSYFGLGLNTLNPAFFSFFAWIFLTIFIYIAGYIVKGAKNVKGKFAGLSSALAYSWLFLFLSGTILLYAFSIVSPLLQVAMIAKENLPEYKAVELIEIMALKNKQDLIEFETENNLTVKQKIELEKMFDEKKIKNIYFSEKGLPAKIESFIFAVIFSLLPFFYGFIILPYLAISEFMHSNKAAHFTVWLAFFFLTLLPAFFLSSFF